MAEELSIISSNLLTNVSESELNVLIGQMVEKSKGYCRCSFNDETGDRCILQKVSRRNHCPR